MSNNNIKVCVKEAIEKTGTLLPDKSGVLIEKTNAFITHLTKCLSSVQVDDFSLFVFLQKSLKNNQSLQDVVSGLLKRYNISSK